VNVGRIAQLAASSLPDRQCGLWYARTGSKPNDSAPWQTSFLNCARAVAKSLAKKNDAASLGTSSKVWGARLNCLNFRSK
jgi:hypothetical protein